MMKLLALPTTMTPTSSCYVSDNGERSTTAARADGSFDFAISLKSSLSTALAFSNHGDTRLCVSTTSGLALAAAASPQYPTSSSYGAKNTSSESTEKTTTFLLSVADGDHERDGTTDDVTKATTKIKLIHTIDALKIRDPDDDVRFLVIGRQVGDDDDDYRKCGDIFSSLRRKSKRRRRNSRKRVHIIY
jgi:hypothetical protein